jgi:murein DD-endopeptidase MepM/ murein hydrolase activator NlpD
MSGVCGFPLKNEPIFSPTVGTKPMVAHWGDILIPDMEYTGEIFFRDTEIITDYINYWKYSDLIIKGAEWHNKGYTENELHEVIPGYMKSSEIKRLYTKTIEMPFLFPIHKEDFLKVTSPFGYRISPILFIEKHHDGLDIQATYRAQVVAVADGYIEQCWPAPNGYFRGHPVYGGLLIINHRNGFRTLYAHLSIVYVGGLQEVKAGDVIGRVGNTGVSNGEHLHFEVISAQGKLEDIVKDAIKYNPLLYINLPN